MAASENSALRLRRICDGARPSTVLIVCLWLTVALDAQNPPAQTQSSFPATETLLPRVVQRQKEAESQLGRYTFTETTTTYTLKKGEFRNQHSDVYDVTPIAYEFFMLRIRHDGKPTSESDLHKQKKEIERKIQEDEKRAQKPGSIHPKDTLLLGDIILKSRFTPLNWDQAKGKPHDCLCF